MSTIRIGNGAGFWGDNLDAPRLLAESGQLDYLTLEYLAELTMSILAHQKSRKPDAGFVTDFPVVLESLLPSLKSQPNLRIVTNAGGMNPPGCAREAAQILSAGGLDDTPVACVTGDALLTDLDAHVADGEPFAHFETDAQLDDVRGRLVSANVYLGAGGIVDALAQGARIVVSGRVADASLTVGPAVYEHDWQWDDWDRLAAATVAGHLIECGAQVTGGMYSDWSETNSLDDVGYPIAELDADGATTITKPAGSGGAVTVGTVAEQLVYEIGDPQHYLTPDVDADFSQVTLEQQDKDCVAVTAARGNPAPDRLKVSMAYHDGYAVSGTLVVTGPRAREKAERCAEIMLARVRRAGFDPERTNVECLGGGDVLPGVQPQPDDPPEVVLRLSAHDASRETVDRLAREFAPLVTSGPPGVTGYTGGRPKPHAVLAYWPTTIARDRVSPAVTVKSVQEWLR